MPTNRQLGKTLAVSALMLVLAGGGPAGAAASDGGLPQFTRYAIEQIDTALAETERMCAAIAAGDVADAQHAWIIGHAGWERAETFTGELYPDLDAAIDAWPDAQAGYHGVEAKLFSGAAADAAPLAAALRNHLRELAKAVRIKGVTAQGLLNGSTQLAFEIGEKKGAGGESAASGTSLDDMRNNVEGLATAYRTVFAPLLAKTDSRLDETTRGELRHLRALLQPGDLEKIDQDAVEKTSERLAIALQNAAPKLGLATPSLGD